MSFASHEQKAFRGHGRFIFSRDPLFHATMAGDLPYSGGGVGLQTSFAVPIGVAESRVIGSRLNFAKFYVPQKKAMEAVHVDVPPLTGVSGRCNIDPKGSDLVYQQRGVPLQSDNSPLNPGTAPY